jgi:hypothetical protein
MDDFCKRNPELCELLPPQEKQYLLDSNAFEFQRKYRIDARTFSPELKKALNFEDRNQKVRYIANKPVKATIKFLTNDRMEQVALVKASKIMFSSGLKDAQKHLDLETQGKWKIIPELSNYDSIVVINPNKQIKIAYRGTEITNAEDVVSDVAIAKDTFTGLGADRQLPQYRRAQEQLRTTILKYSKPVELVGFSLGGNRAMSLSNEFKIPARVFNPFVAGKVLYESNDLVNVTRTVDDIASLGVGYATPKSVESINPLKDNINPVSSHTLDNFETNENRATIEDYRQPLKATGIATGLVAGYLGEKTIKALEKKTGKKLNPDIHSAASGFLGSVYSLPFTPGATFLPVVSSGAIAGYTASKVSKENIGTSNQVARGATTGAVAAGVGYSTLLLGDAYYGAEVGSLFGPEGLVIGTLVGGLIGAASSLIP